MKQIVIAVMFLVSCASNFASVAENPVISKAPSTIKLIPAESTDKHAECIIGEILSMYPMPTFSFQIHPFEINGVLMVPIKKIAEKLEIEITSEKSRITLKNDQNILVIMPNSDTAISNCTISKMPRRAIFVGKTLFIPAKFFADSFHLIIDLDKKTNRLSIRDTAWELDNVKRIFIDIAHQRLYCLEGIQPVFITHTVTARKGYITPTGIYKIFRKIRGKHIVTGKPWSGVMYNPLYFNGPGDYAVHGSTSMPSRPASHGCCRVSIKHKKDEQSPSMWIYSWAPLGTGVYVVNSL